MHIRRDKKTQFIVNKAIKLTANKKLRLASRLLLECGVSDSIIDRVLYESHNVRKSDLGDSNSNKL